MLLLGTGSLLVGFLLKAISITTRFQPHVLGFTSIDFVLIAGICMGFALVLAAWTWVKLNQLRVLVDAQQRPAGAGADGVLQRQDLGARARREPTRWKRRSRQAAAKCGRESRPKSAPSPASASAGAAGRSSAVGPDAGAQRASRGRAPDC